ncbi:MAG: PEP-CTERM sorting domain-containing protein [Candidatus Hydrogenedentes bacterium]|nr:PEP-CTERM sorting domain-containing protein [Candidatus Hydrogenedentota bacterium]
MLRRICVLVFCIGAVMVSGSMLFAQSPDALPPDGYLTPDAPAYSSADSVGNAYENEDQRFSIPFSWDIEPGMDDEFRYAGSATYRSATKSSPQDAPAIVPEPGTMVLMAAGLAALAVRRMRIAS